MVVRAPPESQSCTEFRRPGAPVGSSIPRCLGEDEIDMSPGWFAAGEERQEAAGRPVQCGVWATNLPRQHKILQSAELGVNMAFVCLDRFVRRWKKFLHF